MAENKDSSTSDLENLEALITCEICDDILTEPRALIPCLHTFCFQCIQRWHQSCQKERNPFNCPLCRTSIEAPGGDVANLPNSFQSNSLIQLYNSLILKKKQQDFKDAKMQIAKEIDALKDMLQLCTTVQEQFEESFQRSDQEINSAIYEVRRDATHKIKIIKDEERIKLEQLEGIKTKHRAEHDTVKNQIGEHIQQILDLCTQCEKTTNTDIGQFNTKNFQRLLNSCTTAIERTTSTLSAYQLHDSNLSQGTGPIPEVIEIFNSIQIHKIDENAIERKEEIKERVTEISQSLTLDADSLKPVTFFDIKAPEPWAMALNKNGDIAVFGMDIFRSKAVLYFFSADGGHLREISVEGPEESRIYPWGIAFTNKDRLLVSISDSEGDHACVKEYHIDGRFSRTVYKQNGMEFRGMCTSEQTIACLCYNKRSKRTSIMLFSEETATYLIDVKLHTSNVTDCPLYLTYASNKYFVSFSKLKSICVFDENGGLLILIGQNGTQSQFDRPRGLSVFGADKLLVCDRDNHHVQLFSQEGRYIKSLGSRGSGLGEMSLPIDVAVSSSGDVFVLEKGNNRVQVFR